MDVRLHPTLSASPLGWGDRVDDTECQGAGEAEWVADRGDDLSYSQSVGVAYDRSRKIGCRKSQRRKISLRVVRDDLRVERSAIGKLNLGSRPSSDVSVGDYQPIRLPDDTRTTTHATHAHVNRRSLQERGCDSQLVGDRAGTARQGGCYGCHR
jgi:hypothetical protein